MTRNRHAQKRSLSVKYPPSEPCGCAVCLSYCIRPGWWTVEEAGAAIQAGYTGRMMLEVAPERTFGVLSPAFKGCEGTFALKEFASRGCTFLKNNLCELHGTSSMPLECRFCHHDRIGQGTLCHIEIEQDWRTTPGRALVIDWCKKNDLWELLDRYGLKKLKES